MPSNVLVSGLANTQYNGLYVYDGEVDGKPSYRLTENISIYWETDVWVLKDTENETAPDGSLFSYDNVAYPWLAVSWNFYGIDPTGLVLTETSDSTIFDLQPSVAAEIINRHGSVKRFLRLRNLGYF